MAAPCIARLRENPILHTLALCLVGFEALLESLVAMHPLPTPLAVQCLLLEDKAVGRVAHDGTLVACSLRDGELITTAPLVPLSNVKLLVAGTGADVPGGAPAGEIYAKVTAAADGGTQRARLRFTSVSPELKRWVQQLTP